MVPFRVIRGAALALLLLAIACRRDLAATVLAHARTVPPSTALQADVTRFARVGMHRPIVFNRRPADDEIAIIFVDPATDWEALARNDAAARYVHDNCYTSAAGRTVVCDGAVLVKRPDVLLDVPATEEQRLAFARWILGHELGHIATATAGFHTDPRTDLHRARDLAQQRREYAADCWMVHTFERAVPLAEQIAFESFAIDVINAHFRRAEPDRPAGVGLIFDYTKTDPYDFRGGGTHPDTILRSIRILHVAADARHDRSLQQLIAPLVRKLVPDPLWTDRGPCGLS
ncbi:MAG TPA: hypothetical protein VJZ76_03505 [Thermoanaerobaculia bacterium]|nr:hypothetical protein [Thermoanaerobaculia bacterium]